MRRAGRSSPALGSKFSFLARILMIQSTFSEMAKPEPYSPILLAAVGFTVFAVLTALSMLGPLLVNMAVEWDTSVPVVAQLVTAAAVAWAVTAILVGPFSDAFGRRPIILIGVSLVGLGSIGTALAPNLPSAAFFRVLTGIGGGMVPPTCIALLGDVLPENKRSVGVAIVTTQPGLSSLLGVPFVTLLGAYTSWRTAFFFTGATLVGACVLLARCVPPDMQEKKPLQWHFRFRKVARFPVTWIIASANLCVRTAYGLVITFFPAFLQLTYGLTTQELALPVAVVAFGTTCGMLLGGQMGKYKSRLVFATVGIFVASLPGMGAFLVRDSLWTTVLITSAFTVLCMPVATLLYVVGSDVGGSSRGTLTGILSGSGYGSYALGAVIGGLGVSNFGYTALSTTLLGASLACAFLLLYLVQSNSEERARAHFAAAD